MITEAKTYSAACDCCDGVFNQQYKTQEEVLKKCQQYGWKQFVFADRGECFLCRTCFENAIKLVHSKFVAWIAEPSGEACLRLSRMNFEDEMKFLCVLPRGHDGHCLEKSPDLEVTF